MASSAAEKLRAMMREEYQRRLTEVYEQNCPNRIDSIDGLLDKYAGKEHTIYIKVCQKYREPIMSKYKPVLPESEEEESDDSLDREARELASSSDEDEDDSDEEEIDQSKIPVAWKLLLKQSEEHFFTEEQYTADEEGLFASMNDGDLSPYRTNQGTYMFKLRFPNLEEDRPYDIREDDNGEKALEIVWSQSNSITEASSGEVETLYNFYGEQFDGLFVDEEEECLFFGAGMKVGLYGEGPEGALCGPLDDEWGEPMRVSQVELYVGVQPLIHLGMEANTKDTMGKKNGTIEGDAEIKDSCLFLPKSDESIRGVSIEHDGDMRNQFKNGMTVCMWFQKHFKQQSEGSVALVTKGEWRKNFSLTMSSQLDGDYMRACVKTGQGMKKCQAKFKDKSEFDVLEDKALAEFHEETADVQWHHAALSVDTSDLKLYHNGNVIAEQKNVRGTNITPGDIFIGSEEGNRMKLQGRIFDFCIFDQPLGPEGVVAVMEKGRPRCAKIDETANIVVDTRAQKAEAQAAKMKARMAKKMARRKR